MCRFPRGGLHLKLVRRPQMRCEQPGQRSEAGFSVFIFIPGVMELRLARANQGNRVIWGEYPNALNIDYHKR